MIDIAASLSEQAVILGDDASGAAFSPCMDYRYALWRRWGDGPLAATIGLNPSTADHVENDPTVRRCIGFAHDWGMGGLIMLNIFGYRATLPGDMKAIDDPVGADTDLYICDFASRAEVVVAAWGVHGEHLQRGDAVAALLPAIHCLGVTKHGHPRHPLYLRKGTPLAAYSPVIPSP
jgi:hypothetical protein